MDWTMYEEDYNALIPVSAQAAFEILELINKTENAGIVCILTKVPTV
jgi:hypothetical protein